MGIRHLETFMKQFVPNGVYQTSIADVCLEFESENGIKPTLVIDLMGVVNVLSRDKVLMLYGGRHSQIRIEFENLLQKLSAVANLVFFEDGPVVDTKFETWVKRQNEKYFKMVAVMEQVYEGCSLQDIVENTRDVPTVTTCLTMVEEAAMKYGKLIVTITKECDAELVQYANNDPSVVAVIADDSDFLVFAGRWRYLSMNQLNYETLVTLEYDKRVLRWHLGLNDIELRVLSTLGGNDIIQYEEVRNFHNDNCGHNARYKFQWLAEFIKDRMPRNFNQVINWIAHEVLYDSAPHTKERIVESLQQYKTKFDLPDFSLTQPLLHFCRENYFDFTFATLQQMPKNLTLNYYDLRSQDCPNLFNVASQLFRKQIGILLQHKKKKIWYEVCTKKSHQAGYKKLNVEPIYPKDEVPSLLEFLNRKEYPEHDKLRFKLLKWMIDEKNLKNQDLSAIPTKYFLDILVLVWLTRNGFITTTEADLILLTIKHVELNLMPQILEPPPVVNHRAFRVSFLFTKFHMGVERSLEVTGLKGSMTKLLNFDGVLFHKMYLDMEQQNFKPTPLLLDLEAYRLYK